MRSMMLRHYITIILSMIDEIYIFINEWKQTSQIKVKTKFNSSYLSQTFADIQSLQG